MDHFLNIGVNMKNIWNHHLVNYTDWWVIQESNPQLPGDLILRHSEFPMEQNAFVNVDLPNVPVRDFFFGENTYLEVQDT